MEENTPKLSLIEKIQKNLIMRKLKKNDFTAYQNITSEALKNDEEILKLAWEIAKPENYHEFPENYQKKKIEQETGFEEILKYFSPNIQEQLCLESPTLLMSSSPEIQLKLGPTHPKEIKNFEKEVQLQLALENNELLSLCTSTVQEQAIEQKPELIYYCSDEIKKEKLDDNIDSPLWEEFIKNQNVKLEDIKKIYNKFCYNYNENRDKILKYIATFLELRPDILSKETIQENAIIDCTKFCNLDTQNKIYMLLRSIPSKRKEAGISVKYNESTGSYINYGSFSTDFILNKIEEMYGEDKAQKYKEFIEHVKKSNSLFDNDIIRLFLQEKSNIIEKVAPEKTITFLEKVLINKKRQSDEEEAEYYNEFFDIIKDAYGKKALEILKERPGLNFENIENMEIFCEEVLNNFSKGFVHDLLSYDLGEEGFYITEIAKNKEELPVFKLYYNRISKKIGENVITMKLCLERYRKFKDVLKDAYNKHLTEEQLEKLDAICMMPSNIANITKVEEIEQIDQKIIEELEKQIQLAKKNKSYITSLDDYYNNNIESENTLFSYTNPSSEVLMQLTDKEKKLLNHLKKYLQISNISFNLEKELDELKKENLSITDLFLEKYKLLMKIKEIEMKNFKEKIITGREEIEKAIKDGKNEVKRIVVDGIEIIDLGTMPVNFAMHNPQWNQSNVKQDSDKIENDYLTLENKTGISTISARAEWENDDSHKYETNGYYVYWNFDNNEVMAFMGNGDNMSSDSKVTHAAKLPKARGFSNLSIREYQKQNYGMEIAFYRRYRDHKKIEESPRYGGKIIPDAIFVSNITPEAIQIPTKIFGRNIPIICRGKLKTEEQIKRVTEMIKAQKQIQMFNQTFDKTEETIHSIGR